mgnify:CR=1 FL=1
MPFNFIKNITESANYKKIEQVKLSYDKDALAPVLSKDALEYHYGKLYKAYVDRFNNREGDADFNEAGAFLHELYFPQLDEPNGRNVPDGPAGEFITKHFKSYDKFKEDFLKTAMGIQGSGWVYLSTSGEIKTIANHAVRTDICVLIDWWEHAWAFDYQSDKERYLDNIWKIIDWDVCNQRL